MSSTETEKKKQISVPDTFLEGVANELADYAVGFIKLQETDAQEDAQVAGSGTLVEIDGTYAILTADHVLENLPTSGEVGLILPTRFKPQLHRYTVNMEFAQKLRIGRGACPSDGPDLGLLVLDHSQLGAVKALKSFYNLSKRRDQVLSSPPAIEVGAWLLLGIAHEWTTDIPPEGGYKNVKVFRGMCGLGLVEGERSRDDYDFLEFKTRYHEHYKGPQSYGGFSGGGLWHLLIKESKKGRPEVTDRILSGVAFYQSPIHERIRTITCHGRQSIYRNAIDPKKISWDMPTGELEGLAAAGF